MKSSMYLIYCAPCSLGRDHFGLWAHNNTKESTMDDDDYIEDTPYDNDGFWDP